MTPFLSDTAKSSIFGMCCEAESFVRGDEFFTMKKNVHQNTEYEYLLNTAVCVRASNFVTCPAYISTTHTRGKSISFQRNTALNPCITVEQYKVIEKQCADNVRALGLNINAVQKTATTSFSWPLRMANGLNDCGYYYLANYVDQDTTSPGIKDWNCGTVTYDGHRGDDIAALPYPFYKMDNNQLEVIAAAPGTIVNKVDGNFDKNCAGNNLTANYIIVKHADNSYALYWHMKKNSLTAKVVGQTVALGEYLGVVGSSGSSTSPHLHFEVWSGSTSNTLKEAYSGPCNALNATSWWANQKPYTEPAIIKTQVNLVAPRNSKRG